MRAVLGSAAALVLGVASAHAAACVPWPAGIAGCLTLNKTEENCEAKAAGNVYKKLAPSIITCEQKLVDDVLKMGMASTFDEQGCENAARTAFLSKTSTTSCGCVDTSSIATLAEQVLNSHADLILCDPAGPVISTFATKAPPGSHSQIAGRFPASPDVIKCERKLSKCVSGLVKDWIKCHQTFAKSYVATSGAPTFNETACVFGPIPGKIGKAAIERWNACIVKAGVGTTCQGCEDTAGVVTLTQQQIDGQNDLAFCGSPGAAFVE
jgi:hypothetical protein